jgi:effector-binding domain-containing protein
VSTAGEATRSSLATLRTGPAYRCRSFRSVVPIAFRRTSPTLCVERDAALEELGASAGDVLPRLHAYLASRNASPSGLPFMRFEGLAQKFTVTIGFPIGPDVAGEDEIEVRDLPGGDAVTALFTGAPAGLPAAWDAVISYADRHGRRHAGAWGGIGGWQVYLNDPAVVGQANAQTRLYLPLPTSRRAST